MKLPMFISHLLFFTLASHASLCANASGATRKPSRSSLETHSSPAKTSEKTIGVGFQVGEPTGLTAKLRTSPQQAIDFGVSYSLGQFMLVTVDFLRHFSPRNISAQTIELTPYLGAGPMVGFASARRREDKAGFFRSARETPNEVLMGIGARFYL